jgi:cell wall-associated NlpC family hydrolase
MQEWYYNTQGRKQMNQHKPTKKLIILASLILIIAFVVIIRCFFWANDATINRDINRTDQNALLWARKTTFTPDPKIQKQLADDYVQKYFSPWNNKNVKQSLQKTRALELEVAQKYGKKPGWDENRQRHSIKWIQKIIDNMNLSKIPNLNMKAIAIEDANIRMMPTIDPLFEYWKKAGEGYPFDYLQTTRIYANTPVAVLNISKDGEWYLIRAAGYIGWVQNHNIAFVNNNFMRRWQKPPYVVAIKNNQPIFDNQFRYRSKTHLAILYPLVKPSKAYYKILIAAPSFNKYAKSKPVNLSKKVAARFPIPIAIKNIAQMANNMLGQPYGWGSLYGYNDCSAMTMNLFANFGIWLPRDSTDQIEIGKQISLKDLSNAQKERLIIKQGIPFLTLVHLHGHIMIYIGHKGKEIYTLHNPWGLKTRNLFWQEGRAVIGRAVITPLNLGHCYLNLPSTLLSAIDKISILYEMPAR